MRTVWIFLLKCFLCFICYKICSQAWFVNMSTHLSPTFLIWVLLLFYVLFFLSHFSTIILTFKVFNSAWMCCYSLLSFALVTCVLCLSLRCVTCLCVWLRMRNTLVTSSSSLITLICWSAWSLFCCLIYSGPLRHLQNRWVGVCACVCVCVYLSMFVTSLSWKILSKSCLRIETWF